MNKSGATTPVSLASLLPDRGGYAEHGRPLSEIAHFKQAKVISLKAMVHPPTRSILGTYQQSDLIITADRDPEKQVKLNECLVIKRGNSHRYIDLTLSSGGGVLPPVMMAEGVGVELKHAVDGSLIAVLEDSTAGLIAIVPFGSISHSFARFERAGNQSESPK